MEQRLAPPIVVESTKGEAFCPVDLQGTPTALDFFSVLPAELVATSKASALASSHLFVIRRVGTTWY